MNDDLFSFAVFAIPILTGFCSWLIYRDKNQMIYLKIIGIIPLTIFAISMACWGFFLFLCLAFYLDGGTGWSFG
jgi:hypothetical protein